VYFEYKEGRKAYYRTLVNEHPVLRRYLRGWLRRTDSFPDVECDVRVHGAPQALQWQPTGIDGAGAQQ
jgi:hypothetical protein